MDWPCQYFTQGSTREKPIIDPTLQVVTPEELQLKVAYILLEATVGRGASLLSQIRRQYITIHTDQTGGKTARIRGNAKRKTMSGRSSDYRPLDVTIYGHFEVICSIMTDITGMAGKPPIV